METVDLSLAKRGDECQLRNGEHYLWGEGEKPKAVRSGSGILRQDSEGGWHVPGLGDGILGSWLTKALGFPPEDGMMVTVMASVERVVPQPEPVLTPVEALELIESQAVEETGEYVAFARMTKKVCREALAACNR